MLYKITHNLVAIEPNLYLVKQPIVHTRNSNILQYQLFNTRTNYFRYSFSHTQLYYGILCHMQHSWHPLWTNLNHLSKVITTKQQTSVCKYIFYIILSCHCLYDLHSFQKWFVCSRCARQVIITIDGLSYNVDVFKDIACLFVNDCVFPQIPT